MKTEVFEYKEGDTVLEGYAVFEQSGGKRPGVLVVPDWMGVSDFARKRAEMLGETSVTMCSLRTFTARAFGRPRWKTCAAEASKYQKNRPLLRQRAQAAFDIPKKSPNTDAAKLDQSATASAARRY